VAETVEIKKVVLLLRDGELVLRIQQADDQRIEHPLSHDQYLVFTNSVVGVAQELGRRDRRDY
jgi:hypothetical protein